MKNRVGFSVGVLLLLATLGALCFVEREPAHGRRPLTSWVLQLNSGYAADTEARNAIRKIGTNAIPYLLEWSNYQKSNRMRKMESLYFNLPYWLRKIVQLQYFNRGEQRANGARSALCVLLPLQDREVYTLLDILNTTNKVLLAMTFAAVQGGSESLSPLMAGLTNQDNQVRNYAVDWLRLLKDDAKPALPLLIKLLDEDDSSLTWRVAWTLGQLALEPHLVVPALTNALQRPYVALRLASATALGNFGREAVSATPALMLALTDSDVDVRASATNSLRAVQHE